MNIVRWNPTADIVNMHQELDRVFSDLFSAGPGSNGGTPAFLPIDIARTESELVVEASVPGFNPDEVNVTVDRGILTIQARHEETQTSDDRKYVRQERYLGELHRQIQLGEGLDGDQARASFHNGVLHVSIPVIAKPEPKRIPISTDAR